MKVTVKTEKTYKITINKVTHSGFKKVSDWEGMTKYKNKDGVVIVDHGVNNIFETIASMGIHGLGAEPTPVEFELVKVSSSLMAQ